MFEKEAEEWVKNNLHSTEEDYIKAFKDGAEFGYNKSKAETALLSQHILDLQKDKGNLTDRVRELEQQIENMKRCEICKHYSHMCGCSYHSISVKNCKENGMKLFELREIKENDSKTENA